MKEVISVIVPIYGVEEYLNRCVESIVRQTYPDLEIILVDDSSPDSCPAMCDAWAEKDCRIKVIHKPNGGLSDARNAGLAVMTGQYVCFIDSDDFIEPNYVQTLLEICTETAVDIAECVWDRVYGDATSGSLSAKEKVNLYTPEEALRQHIADRMFKQTVVNKLYKATLIRDELFSLGKTNEDEFWTYKVLGKANKLAHTDAVLYHYFQREGSIIHSDYSLKRLNGVEAKKLRMEYIKEHFPRLETVATLSYISACKYAYQKLTANKNLDTQGVIREKLHQEYQRYFICPNKSLKEKVWYRMFYHFPRLSCRIRNELKIGL